MTCDQALLDNHQRELADRLARDGHCVQGDSVLQVSWILLLLGGSSTSTRPSKITEAERRSCSPSPPATPPSSPPSSPTCLGSRTLRGLTSTCDIPPFTISPFPLRVLQMSGLALSHGSILALFQGKRVYQPVWQVGGGPACGLWPVAALT